MKPSRFLSSDARIGSIRLMSSSSWVESSRQISNLKGAHFLIMKHETENTKRFYRDSKILEPRKIISSYRR